MASVLIFAVYAALGLIALGLFAVTAYYTHVAAALETDDYEDQR